MKFIIDGKPIALARPRFGSGKVYDKQKRIKQGIILQLKTQILDHAAFPIEEVITFKVSFFFRVPTSYSKKKQLSLDGTPYYHRPDLSNLIKFYEDVFQDTQIFIDDCQITKIEARKLYAYEPRTEIELIY